MLRHGDIPTPSVRSLVASRTSDIDALLMHQGVGRFISAALPCLQHVKALMVSAKFGSFIRIRLDVVKCSAPSPSEC